MPIEVRCSCGQVYHADPGHAGRSIRCRCGNTLTIPAPSDPARPKKTRGAGRSGSAPWETRARQKGGSGPAASARSGKWRWLRPTPNLDAWRHAWASARSGTAATILRATTWAYLALAVITALLLWTEADRWWPATVLMFSPRWLFLLPAPPLALAALLLRPRLLLPIVVASLTVLGPVMGFRTGWRRWLAPAAEPELRLITYNVDGEANPRTREIPNALARYHADAFAIQECPAELADPALWPAGWSVLATDGSLCLATRFPVLEHRVIDYVDTGEQGGTGNAALFRIQATHRTIDLAVVHLETVRKGLQNLRYGADPSLMSTNLLVREIGARKVRRWIDSLSQDPIIAGDFNMPVESGIYREDYGDCANAFSTAGRGFGYTRVLKRFSTRIDHVLACGGWKPLAATVGPDIGSDHLPLIVDLVHPK